MYTMENYTSATQTEDRSVGFGPRRTSQTYHAQATHTAHKTDATRWTVERTTKRFIFRRLFGHSAFFFSLIFYMMANIFYLRINIMLCSEGITFESSPDKQFYFWEVCFWGFSQNRPKSFVCLSDSRKQKPLRHLWVSHFGGKCPY